MKRRIVTSLLAWLVAVATVAGIASIAIGAAGRQVTSELVPAASPIAVPISPDPTAVTDGASAGPSTRASSGTGPPTSGPAAPATAVSRAVAADGGRIQARCADGEVSLDGGYARPDRGWRASIRSVRPHRLEIVFALGAQRAVLVTAVCRDGRPVFGQVAVDPRHPVPPMSQTPVPGPGSGSGAPGPGVTDVSSSATPSDQSPTASATGPAVPSGNPSRPGPTPSGTGAPSAPPTSSMSKVPPVRTDPTRTGEIGDGTATARPGATPGGATGDVADDAPDAPSATPTPVDGGSGESGAVAVPETESGCVAGDSGSGDCSPVGM